MDAAGICGIGPAAPPHLLTKITPFSIQGPALVQLNLVLSLLSCEGVPFGSKPLTCLRQLAAAAAMHRALVQPPHAMARKRQQGIHTGKAAAVAAATRSKPKLQTRSPLGPQQARPLAALNPKLGNGSVMPNLYWTAVPMAQLRHYHATPEVASSSSVMTAPFVGLPSTQEMAVTDDPTTFM
jgi:hypothetical protein